MSPFVSYFVYCDKIEEQKIINPIRELSPVSIPGNYSFCVSCGISGLKELGRFHLKVVFVSPSGEQTDVIADADIKLDNGENGEQSQGSMRLDADVRNLVIKEEGVHTAQVFIDYDRISEHRIAVSRRE